MCQQIGEQVGGVYQMRRNVVHSPPLQTFCEILLIGVVGGICYMHIVTQADSAPNLGS